MTITAWRVFKRRHAQTAFTGDGARRFGGRWNSRGTHIVYTAESASLAALELLVHINSHQILESYLLCDVQFDDSLVEELDRTLLPSNWRSNPAPMELRQLGDAWVLCQSSVVLRVPSVIVEMEHSYLLNPNHPSFDRLQIGRAQPFRYDPRLLKEP